MARRTLISLAAMAVGIVLLASRDSTPPASPSLPSDNVQLLTTAFNSGTKQGQAAALATILRPVYGAQDQPVFPPDRRITLHPTTFKRGGEAGATVEAEVSGQGEVLLLLVREDAQWLVFGTESIE